MSCSFSLSSRIVRLIALPGLSLLPFFPAKAQIFESNFSSGTVAAYDFSGQQIELPTSDPNAGLISGTPQPAGVAIYGGNLYVVSEAFGGPSVSEYDTSGQVVHSALIKGLSVAENIAISGDHIFVTDFLAGDFSRPLGTIGEYNLDGTPVNPYLVTGLTTGSSTPQGIAVDGNKLYVVNGGTSSVANGSVVVYTLTDDGGVTAPETLVDGLNSPTGIVVSGSNLFVAEHDTGVVGEYSLTGGANTPDLLTNLANPLSLAVLDDKLFVGNGDGTVGEYTTSGEKINASLIKDLPQGVLGLAVTSYVNIDPPLDVAAAPEPATWTLLIGSLGLMAAWQRRRHAGSVRASALQS